MTRILAP